MPSARITMVTKTDLGPCSRGAFSLGQCYLKCSFWTSIMNHFLSSSNRTSTDIASNCLDTLTAAEHCCNIQMCDQMDPSCLVNEVKIRLYIAKLASRISHDGGLSSGHGQKDEYCPVTN